MVDFSEAEKQEKKDLLKTGFENWDRRDYQRFCQALEMYPKEDYNKISQVRTSINI